MTYGKEYKILNNFQEFDDEERFEDKLRELCKQERAVLFINGIELSQKR